MYQLLRIASDLALRAYNVLLFLPLLALPAIPVAVWLKTGQFPLGLAVIVFGVFLSCLIALVLLFVGRYSMPTADSEAVSLEIPRELLRPVHDIVDGIATQHGLQPPILRLGVGSAISAYRNERGQHVLSISASSLAVLTADEIGWILAYGVLGIASGDADLRTRIRRFLHANRLFNEHARESPFLLLNPWTLVLRALNGILHLLFAWYDRQATLFLDRRLSGWLGKRSAAVAVIRMHVLPSFPVTRIERMVASGIANNEDLRQIFAIQWETAKNAGHYEWESQIRKLLRGKASVWDMLPSLRTRLTAIGVRQSRAIRWALESTGPPAASLFPHWQELEQRIIAALVDAYRDSQVQMNRDYVHFLGAR